MMTNTVAASWPIIWQEAIGPAKGRNSKEGKKMLRIRNVLEKAQQHNRITRQDWEAVISLATVADEVILNGENEVLFHLVSLLEGGEVAVEGVPHNEILKKLAVFS
jgi:hypothetical protein